MPVKQIRSSLSRKEPPYSGREWTEVDGLRFRKIRKSLGLGQGGLAEKLGVDQSLISAWERGGRRGRRPSSGLLLKFAAFPTLDHDDRLWLIGKAGMDPDTIEFSAAGFLKQSSEPTKPGETVPIKPMRKLEGEGPDLRFPKRVVPNWVTTKYITLRDNFMQPIHKSGDILLIDESQNDPWKLDEGACLATYLSPAYAEQQHWDERRKRIEETHPKEEVKERRQTMSFPYERIGLSVGWLRKQIETDAEGKYGLFFLEAPWLPVHIMLPVRQPHHDPGIEIVSARTILGRVIAWVAGPESAKLDGKK